MNFSGVKTVSEVEDQYQQRINELFAVPEHLQTKTISLTEDMLSDQVLTGTFNNLFSLKDDLFLTATFHRYTRSGPRYHNED